MNLLAHFGLIHALIGGFFDWFGVAGAVIVDVLGLVGVYRRIVNKSPINWWYWMPASLQSYYVAMHSLQFTFIVLVLECTIRAWFNIWIGFENGMASEYIGMMPTFTFGYLSHVLTDWYSHRNDIGLIVRRQTGRMFGINWYDTTFYWMEVAALCLCLLAATQFTNILLWWMR